MGDNYHMDDFTQIYAELDGLAEPASDSHTVTSSTGCSYVVSDSNAAHSPSCAAAKNESQISMLRDQLNKV